MGFLNAFNPNKNYPLKVLIREQRGGNTRWAEDRGGRFKNEDKVDVIRLKKRKEEFAAPPYGFYDINDNKQSVLELFSPKSGVYIPIKHVSSGVAEKLYLSDSSVDEWAALARKALARLTKPKENWWEKWVPLFGMLGIAALLMVSLILVFNALPGVLSQEQGVIGKIYDTALIQAGQSPPTVVTPPKVG